MQSFVAEDAMENDIETVATKRVQARMGFWIHLTLYAITNTALIGIWFVTGRGYPWFVWPMFGWGIGIVGHTVAYAIGPGSAAERRAIDREVQRLRAAH
jgi:hypothetical protein